MIRPTLTALMLGAAALAGAPALAQTAGTEAPSDGQTQTETATPDAAPAPGQGMGRGQGMGMGMGRGQGPRCDPPGSDCPGGQGQGMGRGPGMADGSGRGPGMGMHHGRHHGGMGMMGGRSGPTLRIKTEGRGFEIEFECNAEIAECLDAIERVYRITGENRRRGPGGKDD